MQKTILLAALLLLSASLFGQHTFHKKFQGGGFFSTTPISTGGVLGSGAQGQQFTSPHGLLVQLGEDGEVIWRKRYPALNFIRQAIEADNGWVVVGDSTRPTGSVPRPRYTVIAKLDILGNVIWSKKIGNELESSLPDRLIKVPDGYLVSGIYGALNTPSQSRSFMLRVDEGGNTLWSKTYFGNNSNQYNHFAGQYVEGDTLYACGDTQGNGCFIRINLNNGELIGVSSFGGIYLEDISTLKPTQDGNFVLGGFTRSTTGSEESRPWVVKVNRTGQIIWSKTYNLLGTSLTSRMAEADDGGFVLSMAGDNAFTTGYAIIAKIDASGNFLWAYNYAGGQEVGFGEIKLMPDGGFAALGAGGLLKTDRLGRVSNGCCPAPIAFQVEDYLPPYQNPSMMAEDWENTTPFPMQAVTDVLFTASDYCEFAITSIVQQVLLCEEEFFEINGEFFQAPATVRDTVLNLDGGCDTVRVFNLLQAPQPFQVKTIRFCPGTSVVVDGIEYTEPDAIFQILPAATGCDTLLVTFLELSPLPKKYETTRFCPGDTVFVNGIGYQYPTFFPTPDTLPSSSNGCDTLLFHILAYPSEPSSISANCPPDMLVSTATATPVLVNYAAPSGTSDCTCPDLYFSLTQGIPSGGAFPVGITQVCYSVSDVCGDYETCCFEVKVQEEEACDLKQTACIRYELLGIAADAEQNKTYRVRVTNLCASPLAYTAMQIPNGVEALLPAQNSTYISPNGREYAVRNPSHTPFRSLRFKALGNGIAGGQSDVFEYTLPAQASPVFIRAATRLASGLTYEATLNTFDCVLQAGGGAADRAARKPNMTAGLRLFPNPSSGAVFVDFSAWGEVSVQLRIMNTQGQELTQAQVSTGGTTQPVLIPSTLPDGLYFLEARAENGEKWTAKFVLRR